MSVIRRTDAEEARDYVPAAINHPARLSFHGDHQRQQQGGGFDTTRFAGGAASAL
jgi:hypothetical protein